jgi:hypothetical protein
MQEWQWDLGPDGPCRLVRDDQGVQTVYVGARIAARGPAKVDEHRVLLAARAGGVPEASDRYRQADVPARELTLRRTRHGWTAVLEGRELFPTEWTAPVAPLRPMAPFAQPSGRALPIAATVCALVGIAVAVACFMPGSYLRAARERYRLVHAPHETELGTTFATAGGAISVQGPSDFQVADTSATVLELLRGDLGEGFAVLVVADPSTSDIDALMRRLADRIRTRKAADPIKGDTLVLTDAVPDTCHGEPGRELSGTFQTEAGMSFRFWCCASLRPGVGIGEHRPPIQLFQTVVPEPLAARDEPLLRAMVDAATIRDDALELGGVPALSTPPTRQEPMMFPQGIMAGPGHVTTVTRRP